MGIAELALIGVGLSMDAFAASVCKGLSMKKVGVKYGLIMAGFFGGVQGLMPLLGRLLGGGGAAGSQPQCHAGRQQDGGSFLIPYRCLHNFSLPPVSFLCRQDSMTEFPNNYSIFIQSAQFLFSAEE